MSPATSKMDRKQMAKTNPTQACDGFTPVFYWIILKIGLSLRSLSMLVNIERTKEVIYATDICCYLIRIIKARRDIIHFEAKSYFIFCFNF